MPSVLSVSLPEKISSELEKSAKKTDQSKSDIVKDSISIVSEEDAFKVMS